MNTPSERRWKPWAWKPRSRPTYGAHCSPAWTTSRSTPAITDLTDPTAATATATLPTYLSLFSDAVDAKAAIDFTQVRLLLGLSTYKHAYGLTIANIGTAFELLPRERIRSSSHLAQSNSGDQVAIAYKTGGGVNRFIAPVWRRMEILRDPYHAGQIRER